MFTGSKEAQPVPFAAEMFFPQSCVISSLDTLKCLFVVFPVWLVGFLTKMNNLHHILFFSYTLSHRMISEDCTGVWQWQIFDLCLTLVAKAIGHSFSHTLCLQIWCCEVDQEVFVAEKQF